MIRRCKLGFTTILLIMAVLVFSGAVQAVSVEPDNFTAGTNISNTFANVTLSSVGTGWGSPSGNIFSVDPSIQSSDKFTPTTGSLVFGTDDTRFPHLFREVGFLSLRADFAIPVATVSIDFIGTDDVTPDVGILAAYNSAGILLKSYTTAGLSTNAFETAMVSGIDIAYIIASGDSSNSAIGIDNLNYSAVPLPGAVWLLGSGLLGLAGWRRFRKG